MKEFKTLPKMQCGGKVKKYSGEDGSHVLKDTTKFKSVPMPAPDRNPEGRDIPGIGKVKSVPMPTPDRNTEGRDIPGVGRVKPIPMPTRGDAMLLKKGGKIKRGMKK
jgi:hypothetical protein